MCFNQQLTMFGGQINQLNLFPETGLYTKGSKWLKIPNEPHETQGNLLLLMNDEIEHYLPKSPTSTNNRS